MSKPGLFRCHQYLKRSRLSGKCRSSFLGAIPIEKLADVPKAHWFSVMGLWLATRDRVESDDNQDDTGRDLDRSGDAIDDSRSGDQ